MKINIYMPPSDVGPQDHLDALMAFAEGLRAHGVEWKALPLTEGYRSCDVMVVFGRGKFAVPQSWNRYDVLRQHVAFGRPYILLEKGFVKRDEYFHVGWNGHNNYADFRNADSPSDRWEKLGVPLQPWRSHGRVILLCGQVPWDSTVEHTDHVRWLTETYKRLVHLSDTPVMFRAHPKSPPRSEFFIPGSGDTFTLDEDLERARSVVAYNSTVATDAIIAGVPAFVQNDGSMAWPVANRDILQIDVPVRPPREQWAANLAYAQWTLAEMESGECWEHLK